MSRVVINIVFIILLSLVIFPVKEVSEWLLSQQNTQASNDNDDEDDDGDATADFAKKIDFKLKFEAMPVDDYLHQSSDNVPHAYIEYCFQLPLNHSADVQTPPPNC